MNEDMLEHVTAMLTQMDTLMAPARRNLHGEIVELLGVDPDRAHELVGAVGAYAKMVGLQAVLETARNVLSGEQSDQ